MPATNTDETPSTDMSAASIVADAKAQRTAEVRKELVKKHKVIAKRRGQLDAHVATFTKKVADFEKAADEAGSPEVIMAVLAKFKFPAESIAFAPPQDD